MKKTSFTLTENTAHKSTRKTQQKAALTLNKSVAYAERCADAKMRTGVGCYIKECFGKISPTPLLKKNFSPFTYHISREGKRYAFTLAEVLITLGIIGVVAAITLPTLIQNHRNHVVETRLKKFYSTINQAVALAEQENGDRTLWYIDTRDNNTNREWFDKYLKKHLQIVKENERLNLYYFSDGTALRRTQSCNRDWTFFPGNPEKCMNLGTQSEYQGRCAFQFFFEPTGAFVGWRKDFGPAGRQTITASNKWELTGQSIYGCREGSQTSWFCANWIMSNGWKIPKDYPFKVRY